MHMTLSLKVKSKKNRSKRIRIRYDNEQMKSHWNPEGLLDKVLWSDALEFYNEEEAKREYLDKIQEFVHYLSWMEEARIIDLT
jgi:hypothetical protein